MCASIHSLCYLFTLLSCTFDRNYSLKSFSTWCRKLDTPICPFPFAASLKLHQVGREATMHISKSHQGCSVRCKSGLRLNLGSVLRVEPSEARSALEQVLIQGPPWLASQSLPLRETPPQHEHSQHLHASRWGRCWPTLLETLTQTQQLSFPVVSSDLKLCFSWSEFHVSFKELPPSHSTQQAWLVDWYRDGCPYGTFSSPPQRSTKTLKEWPSCLWSPPWLRFFSP